MADKQLNESEELFLAYLEENASIPWVADQMGISKSYAYQLYRKLKEEIQDRTRDKLTLAGLKAANTLTDLMDADSSTQQGALKLKASESVLDRMGATKQSSIDVSIDTGNGLFILPAKTEVPEESTVTSTNTDAAES